MPRPGRMTWAERGTLVALPGSSDVQPPSDLTVRHTCLDLARFRLGWTSDPLLGSQAVQTVARRPMTSTARFTILTVATLVAISCGDEAEEARVVSVESYSTRRTRRRLSEFIGTSPHATTELLLGTM